MTQEQGPQKQADILLESGTNELEILVFGIGDQAYGVNVAKVREVIPAVRVTASPGQPKCVKGVFNLRGVVLPLVNLHMYLNIEPLEKDIAKHRIIVTEFNGAQAAFQVEWVEQIYRMSWSDMRPVPETYGKNHFSITGLTEINDRLVLMLDFESIFDHISMQDKMHVDKVENKLGVDRESQRIWMAEDSFFIRGLMTKVLSNSGYHQVKTFNNGADAWEALCEALKTDGELPTTIITDIEMPQMDGFSLTRRIKENNTLKKIPVVLFSSLITEDTRHKGNKVGADQQMAKPQLPELVSIIDHWIKNGSTAEGPAQTA